MAELITVDDPGDPRLADYTGLTDVELRRRREPAEGLFIAEGEKVIRRALQAGYPMRSMLLSAKWTEVMPDVIDEVPAPVHVVSPGAGRRGHRLPRAPRRARLHGTQAAARREELLEAARRVVVMEAVIDHTNIGAIFRSAAALGMDGCCSLRPAPTRCTAAA